MADKKREHDGDESAVPAAKRACLESSPQKDDGGSNNNSNGNDTQLCHIEVKSDREIWTPETFPKPPTGYLLLIYINQNVNSINSEPVTQYCIPVKEIADEDWSFLVAANNFIFTIDDQIDDLESKEDRAILNTLFKRGKLHALLEKFDCFAPRHVFSRVLASQITAVITTGIVGD